MPEFNAQLLGRAEKAANAILQRLLDPSAMTEPQWVALVLVALGEGASREELVARVAAAQKVSADDASSRLHELEAGGWIASSGSGLTPTASGGSGLTPTASGGSGLTPTASGGSGLTPTASAGSGLTPTASAGSGLTLTAAGTAHFDRVRTAAGAIGQRLWGDLPSADLEAAGRVLTSLLERADAELAALA